MTDRVPCRVGLGLIHWNSGDLTRACLESIQKGSYQPDFIAILDNGSTDGEMDNLTATNPNVLLIRKERNIGFASAANELIRAIRARTVDYLWLLNNDTIVDTDVLEKLVNAMNSNPEIEACSARIVLRSDPSKVWYGGGGINTRWVNATHDLSANIDNGEEEVRSVTFISGCCMLFRDSAIESVGKFDEAYFAYAEDADWCFRAARLGFRLGYVPNAVIQHAVSASVRRQNLGRSRGTATRFQQFLSFRSRALLIRKHAQNKVYRFIQLGRLFVLASWVALGQIALCRFEKVLPTIHGYYCGCFDQLNEHLREDVQALYDESSRNVTSGVEAGQ